MGLLSEVLFPINNGEVNKMLITSGIYGKIPSGTRLEE